MDENLPELYAWQKKAVYEARDMPNYALLATMGVGKTRCMIEIMRLLMNRKKNYIKTLIVGPLATLWNWRDEIGMYSKIDKNRVYILHGTKKQKNIICDKAASGDNIIIMNFEGLLGEDVFQKILEWQPETVIVDEGHKIKNYKSKRSKALVKISDTAKNRYLLTGTPLLNSVADIFMQYRFLEPRIFGNNFYTFQSKYMYDKNAGWRNMPNHFANWVARPDMYKDLNDKIYSCAIRVTKEECLKDMPPLVKIIKHVEMSPQQKKMYKEMYNDFVTFVKKKSGESELITADLAITKALRLQQIITGFVKDSEGNTHIISGKNPRLVLVKELLEELHQEHKIIIWCVFKQNYKQLGKLLEEMKIKHAFLTGELSGQAKQDSMEQFRKDPATRVIVANMSAGGTGVNLIEADYSIVYSRNFSLGDALQSEARNFRGGSQMHKKIVKIDLVTKETIDETIVEAINNKQKISDAVIDLVKEN